MLNTLEITGLIDVEPVDSGEHSNIYKLNDKLCLKLFKYNTDVEWNNEFTALSQLQEKQYVPKLFAYSENKFLLIEWIDGYNLMQYVEKFGEFPNAFIKHYFDINIDLMESGFAEWDFKLSEHLIWTAESLNIVKKIDYGVCENTLKREDTRTYSISRERKRYQELVDKEPNAIYEFKQELYRCGFSAEQVSKIL